MSIFFLWSLSLWLQKCTISLFWLFSGIVLLNAHFDKFPTKFGKCTHIEKSLTAPEWRHYGFVTLLILWMLRSEGVVFFMGRRAMHLSCWGYHTLRMVYHTAEPRNDLVPRLKKSWGNDLVMIMIMNFFGHYHDHYEN